MKPKLRIDIDPPLADLIEGFGQLERMGDIVPYAFFEELKVPDESRTAFYRWAKALVLSYIVSWHMPKILVIDGVEVHRKRFQGDKLMLVYSQVTDIFKCSADTIYLAVKDLADVDKLIEKGRDEEGYVHVVPKLKEIAALLAKWKAKQDAKKAKAKGTAIPRSETTASDPLQSANPAATPPGHGTHAATSGTPTIPLPAVGIPVAAAPLPLGAAPLPLAAVSPTARSGIPIPVAAAPHTAPSGTSQFRSQFPSQNQNPLPPSPGQSPSEAGGGCPPSEVSPTATGGKPPGPPHTPNGEVQEPGREGQLQSDQEERDNEEQRQVDEQGDEVEAQEQECNQGRGRDQECEAQHQNDAEDSPQALAETVAGLWPELMTRLMGRKVVWPKEATALAVEFFENNSDWGPVDVLWVCFKGHIIAKENPDEDMKLFNCHRFATNPRRMFLLNSNGKLPLERMSEELIQWDDFVVPRSQELYAAVNEELVRLSKKPFELEPQEEAGQRETQSETPPEAPAQQCIPVADEHDDAPKTLGIAYREAMGRLGLDLSLDRDAIRSAAEFLHNDASYSSGDIVAICVLGAVAAAQNPPPPDGKPDPFLYCGNFALSPKKIFGRSGADDLRLLKMACELNYEPLPPTDIIEAIDGAVMTVQKNNWFGHLKNLAEWQEKQAEERRNDPRQYDRVDHFKCL